MLNENLGGILHYTQCYGAFTLDVKLMFNENLGGILDGTQMLNEP